MCGPVGWQQSCGCCYAFAGVNAIECNYKIKTGKTVTLSRQQVIDCNPLTNGCHGGTMDNVAIYAHTFGLMPEDKYTFKGDETPCEYNANLASSIYIDAVEEPAELNFFDLSKNPYYNWNNVYNMLSKGALYTTIDADSLVDVGSGVVDLKYCGPPNHAVLIVGYGVDPKDGAYWLIKNSWNTYWGENGYFKVKVQDDSKYNCSIHKGARRPIIN